MIRELSQGRFFIKRQIKIFENKVHYRESKFGSIREFSIAYEDLLDIKTSMTLSNPGLLIGSAALFVINLLFLIGSNGQDRESNEPIIFGVAFAGMFFTYLVMLEKVWKIMFSNFTFFYISKNSPNKFAVDQFIDVMFSQRNKYLRETYLFIDRNLPYEKQLNNFQWLKKVGVIQNDEFEMIRRELATVFNIEKRTIGFGAKLDN